MKKVFNLLFIVAFIFVLSSCGFKKEIEAPEIDGDKMSKSSVEDFYKKYEDYCKKIAEGNKAQAITKGWYSVAANVNYTMDNNNENDRGSMTLKAKISGDMYDSNYVFDKMAHLTVRFEMDTDGEDEEDVQHIEGTYEMFLKEGMSWVKGSFTSEKEDEKETKKVYAKGSFKELIAIIPDTIKDIFDFSDQSNADMQVVGYSFMEGLKNVDEETTTVYQKDDTYTIKTDINSGSNDSNNNESSIKAKSISEVKFKDIENYIAKEYNQYGDIETSFEKIDINITYETSIKKKVMGIIIPSIFEGKYQNYGDSDIFPEL